MNQVSPKCDPVGADYHVTWDYLVMKFSKLKEHSEGYSAYLVIAGLDLPGFGNGTIFEGRLQLQGTRSKADVVKECERRFGDLVDWTSRLTRSCRLVMDAIEDGEPIICLPDLFPVQSGRYILEPILRETEPTLMFGLAGTGKSTIALALAAILTDGKPRLGFTVAPNQRVLYLDYEDSQENVARRLEMMSGGLEFVQHPRVLYKRGTTALSNLADMLARQVWDQKITGLIVDSAALACGAEPEVAESANAYFRALRALNLQWSVTIAHQPHSAKDDPRPFGSVFWQNNPRSIWNVKRVQDEGDSILHIGVFHKKASNGRLHHPLGFKIEHTDYETIIEREDVASVGGFEKDVSQKARLYQFIAEHPGSTRMEAQNTLSFSSAQVRDALFKLKGFIVERDNKMWRIDNKALQ